jgi:riboflavin synthase
MFTGIVMELGRVARAETESGGVTLDIVAPGVAAGAQVGDSVAIDGCCLTVTAGDGDVLRFHAMAESLRRTTLADLRAGAYVNLEPALRVGDRMGGHWVQGHVDGVGEATGVEAEGDARVVTFSAPARVLRYIVEKGSICVAGVSLTVTAVDASGFSVALVPHTLAVTTLGAIAPGDRVNLEADLVGKYVERFVFAGSLIPSAGPS